MNEVDYLLVNQFSSLTHDERRRIKELGPHRPCDLKITKKNNGHNRHFNTSLMYSVEWLTASVSKEALFCFYCLLFGGDSTWTKNGFKDINHLQRAINSHNSSKAHITNAVRYKMFGSVNITTHLDDARRTAASEFNEQVKTNRYVVSKIIGCILFCGKHELPLHEHDDSEMSSNKGVFFDLLERDAKTDLFLYNHLTSSTVARYTSKDVQNELLDSIYNVYFEELKLKIQEANFISIQVDKAIDTAHLSQFVIILRFVQKSRVRERFLKFEEISNHSAQGLTSVLKAALDPFRVTEKLVCQAYDGAAVLTGQISGVQTLMREHFPYVIFVPCYAHQLNLILEQACCGITECKIFFANASGFATFFSHSSKRYDILCGVCDQTVPQPSDMSWSFHSRLIGTIYDMKQDLEKCFETIQGQQWDNVTTREATGLLNTLRDSTFVFFLENFHKIFIHVDILCNALQRHNSTIASSHKALNDFVEAIQKIKSEVSHQPAIKSELDLDAPKRRREDFQTIEAALEEACDVISLQIQDRFSNLDVTYSLRVVDPLQFRHFERKFPSSLLDILLNCFTFLDGRKLKSELEVLYSNKSFQECQSTHELYSLFKDCDLGWTFSEVIKVLEIILTSPSTTIESEGSFSTLGRVKNLSRSTMEEDRLNALALLTIHKDIEESIDNFIEKVINNFALSKHGELNYFTSE